MIKPSEKTKRKLAKRLERFGVKYGKILGEWMFIEPVKVCIPTNFGIRFIVDTEYPVHPMRDDVHYSQIIGNRISRLARAYHLDALRSRGSRSNKVLENRAMEAAGEFTEFLQHIKNPRVQVV